MEFGIEKCDMLIMKIGKKINSGRNRSTKSGKHQKRKIASTWEYWKWTQSNNKNIHPGYRNGI